MMTRLEMINITIKNHELEIEELTESISDIKNHISDLNDEKRALEERELRRETQLYI